MSLLLRRSSDEETIEVREDPEPTSIEFQNTFKELVNAVLKSDERRLVIVVDNLDRIDLAETRSAWALLRSFLDSPQFVGPDALRKLWVIVPVADENRMLHATPSKNSANEAEPHFFEKVFQLKLSLPPLMLHSWKNYLHASLTSAFGEDVTGDFDEILRLYESIRSEKVTPRAIVSFVNELVVAQLEWQDKVSISILAAYILYGSQFESSGLKIPEVVGSILRVPTLEETFNMLHHRASTPEEASYLTVLPRLESALDDGNSDALEALLNSSKANDYVLDRHIREGLTQLEKQQERLLQAVKALAPFVSGTEGKPKLSLTAIAHLRTVIRETFEAGKVLRLGNPNLSSGLRALLDISIDSHETANTIIRMLRGGDGSSEASFVNREKELSQKWRSWLPNFQTCLLFDEIRPLVRAEDFEKIPLPVDSDAWSCICEELAPSEFAWMLDCCRSSGGTDSDFAWLMGQVSSQTRPNTLALLKYHVEHGHSEFFDEIARAVAADSQRPGNNVGVTINAALFLFHFDRDRAKPYLKQLSTNTFLEAIGGYQASSLLNEGLAQIILLVIFSTDGILSLSASASPIASKYAHTGLGIVTSYLSGQLTLDEKRAEVFAQSLDNIRIFEVLPICAQRGLTNFLRSLVLQLARTDSFCKRFIRDGTLDTELAKFGEMYIPDIDLRTEFTEHALATVAMTTPQISAS
ncbi:hypothetical protein GCM10027093_02930 [Paraburkholderia jirisanensis]